MDKEAFSGTARTAEKLDVGSELLTRPETAAILRVKVGTLAQWAFRGVGPRFFRPDGGRALYRRKDIEQWLADGEGGGP